MRKKSDFEGWQLAVMVLLLLIPSFGTLAKTAKTAKTITSQIKYIDKYYQVDQDGRAQMHIYLGDEKIATIDNRGNISFPLVDQLGSPVILTDQTGQIVASSDFGVFGDLRLSTGTVSSDYKFTGKELDQENNLEYFGARYYDSGLARFVSIDPVLLGDFSKFLANPQALNSYSYALNNPIALIDPFGLSTATVNPMPDSGWQLDDVMGQFNGVTAYYNGINSYSQAHSCVEYAKRYMEQIYGIRLGSVVNPNNMWSSVNILNERLGKVNSDYTLMRYVNGRGFDLPGEGDMLIWTDKHNGHVMIVTESNFDNKAGKGYVEIIDQNASSKAVRRFDVNRTDQGYTVLNKSNPIAGWLSPVNKNAPVNNPAPAVYNVQPSQSAASWWERAWQGTRQFFNKIF